MRSPINVQAVVCDNASGQAYSLPLMQSPPLSHTPLPPPHLAAGGCEKTIASVRACRISCGPVLMANPSPLPLPAAIPSASESPGDCVGAPLDAEDAAQPVSGTVTSGRWQLTTHSHFCAPASSGAPVDHCRHGDEETREGIRHYEWCWAALCTAMCMSSMLGANMQDVILWGT